MRMIDEDNWWGHLMRKIDDDWHDINNDEFRLWCCTNEQTVNVSCVKLQLRMKSRVGENKQKTLKSRDLSDWWATDEQLMSNWWATDERLMSDWWATDERLMSDWWATDERLMSDCQSQVWPILFILTLSRLVTRGLESCSPPESDSYWWETFQSIFALTMGLYWHTSCSILRDSFTHVLKLLIFIVKFGS